MSTDHQKREQDKRARTPFSQRGLLDQIVADEQYQNASEGMREGLRLVEEKEREKRAKLVALRNAADIEWQGVEAGRFTDVSADELGRFMSRIGEEIAHPVESE